MPQDTNIVAVNAAINHLIAGGGEQTQNAQTIINFSKHLRPDRTAVVGNYNVTTNGNGIIAIFIARKKFYLLSYDPSNFKPNSLDFHQTTEISFLGFAIGWSKKAEPIYKWK